MNFDAELISGKGIAGIIIVVDSTIWGEGEGVFEVKGEATAGVYGISE